VAVAACGQRDGQGRDPQCRRWRDHDRIGSLTVEALDDDSHAIATTKSAGGGVVSVSGAKAHANLYSDSGTPHIRAMISDGAHIDVGGHIDVRGKMTDAQANATATGVSVSLVHVDAKAGGSTATADLSPQIRAVVSSNATLLADGNITIEALQATSVADAKAYARRPLLFGMVAPRPSPRPKRT
jgi:hypothetical protein